MAGGESSLGIVPTRQRRPRCQVHGPERSMRERLVELVELLADDRTGPGCESRPGRRSPSLRPGHILRRRGGAVGRRVVDGRRLAARGGQGDLKAHRRRARVPSVTAESAIETVGGSSSSVIVPTPASSAMVALDGAESRTPNVSSGSSSTSPMIETRSWPWASQARTRADPRSPRSRRRPGALVDKVVGAVVDDTASATFERVTVNVAVPGESPSVGPSRRRSRGWPDRRRRGSRCHRRASSHR